MEELEATSVGRGLDPDVVDGRDWIQRQLEVAWIRTLLMEELEVMSVGRGLDPDVIDGRIGRDIDWKDGDVGSGRRLEGDWIRRRLEGDWIRRQLDVNWKCWIRRQLEGLDPTSIGRGLDPTSVGR